MSLSVLVRIEDGKAFFGSLVKTLWDSKWITSDLEIQFASQYAALLAASVVWQSLA